MLIYDLINIIESNIIKSPATSWDNVGLLIGDNNANITKCILSLDFTKDVLNEAIEKDAQLVINHHPVIFDNIKKITSENIAYKAIENNINIYAAHTNLDATEDGINDKLCEIFDFDIIDNIIIDNLPLCKLCTLKKPMYSKELATYVKEKLNIDFLTYTNCHNQDNDKLIYKVAVLGGGGNAGVEKIYNKADALITGEVKHENTVFLYNNMVTLIQAGHFNTESIILSYLAKTLQEKIPSVEFIVADSNKGTTILL